MTRDPIAVILGIYFAIALYTTWVLVLSGRTRKVFSEEYQHRLKHNAFDRWKIGKRSIE